MQMWASKLGLGHSGTMFVAIVDGFDKRLFSPVVAAPLDFYTPRCSDTNTCSKVETRAGPSFSLSNGEVFVLKPMRLTVCLLEIRMARSLSL